MARYDLGRRLKELQDVFHTFVFDILGIKDEAAPGGSNNNEAFGKAMDLLLTIRQQAKANKDWVHRTRSETN